MYESLTQDQKDYVYKEMLAIARIEAPKDYPDLVHEWVCAALEDDDFVKLILKKYHNNKGGCLIDS